MESQAMQNPYGLTRAQFTALWNLDDSDSWQRAPHDGYRRAGQACSSLVNIGLAEKAIEDCGIFYRLNSAGRKLRAEIRAAPPHHFYNQHTQGEG